MSELQKISLGVVVNNNSEILLINRNKTETFNDGSILSWAFPGGKVEHNEDSNKAAEREVLEETGYEVRAESLILENQHSLAPVFVSYWACSLIDCKNIIGTDDSAINSYAWVSIRSLNKYLTSPLNTVVEQYLKDRLC